jgi:hypothetical protein
MSDSEAEQGVVTAGNARHSFEDFDQLDRVLSATPSETLSVLLSSEYVFRHLPDLFREDREQGYKGIDRLNRRYEFTEWKILLFIRDPMPFAVSAWLQLVKGHRERRRLEEFVLDWPSLYPQRVRGFIELCSELDFVKLSLFNYSRIEREIVPITAGWLGIDHNELITPKTSRINRSLTASESYVIARLNRSKLQMKDHLGKILVERLPSVESGEFTLPREIQIQFVEKVKDDMEYVANYVPDGHEYRVETLPESSGSDTHCFTTDQLEVILDYLTDNVSRKKLFRK